jgi:lipoprotein-releasing system permease protein
MYNPVSFFIGLRYTRSKRRNRFVSFISLISMLGIALGVTVLITVLSVMNGFDQQIRERIFTLVPHVTVTGYNNTLSNWRPLEKRIEKMPHVTGIMPVVVGQGLLSKDGVTAPALVNGILPQDVASVSALNSKVVEGKLSDLKSGNFGIMLGDALAANLGLIQGDSVNLITPKASITPVGVIPRFKQFKVDGIFHAGSGFGFDTGFAYINMADAQKLFMMGSSISQFQIKVDNLFAAPKIREQMQKALGPKYIVSDWTAQYGAFYHAVQMEKTMMFLILLLIIAVAAFNLVSSLMMMVNEKEADIAILKTIGATPKKIMSIFMIQGFVIGATGTILGLIGGIVLSLNVTRVVNIIQNVFNVQLVNANVYFVSFLPSQLQFSDLWHVCLVAFILSVLATLYPAWQASKIQPAEALRYE